jgi:uncharacterized protein (TIGR00255 family)
MNSMTGFGRASRKERGLDLEVEIRSVNHRFLLVKQNLPEGFARQEAEIEQKVRDRLGRGSVTVHAAVRAAEGSGPALPPPEALESAARGLRKIRKALKIGGDLTMEELLAVPGLWKEAGAGDLDAHAPKLLKLVGEALDALEQVRAREGASIVADLHRRLDAIGGLLDRVQARVPAVVEAYQRRLEERIRQLLEQKGFEASKPDVLREVAIHADRCDISEECQRLRAHLAEFRKILASKGPAGRRLDFLSQEMGREINTTASKGNDAEISARTVEMKAELEKIKEQVENLE